VKQIFSIVIILGRYALSSSSSPYPTKGTMMTAQHVFFFHSHFFYSHVILHTVHPSFIRATSARVPIHIHTHHSFRYMTFIPPHNMPMWVCPWNKSGTKSKVYSLMCCWLYNYQFESKRFKIKFLSGRDLIAKNIDTYVSRFIPEGVGCRKGTTFL
jgi:hypothetical protein